MSPSATAWRPGQSGNPAGKPPGTRNHATRAVEALLDGQAEALTKKAVEMALAGDGPALKLCLDRLCPPRKDRTVSFALPPIAGPADLPAATEALMRAVAEEQLTPGEATELSRVIETHLRAIEVREFGARLAEIEAAREGGQSCP